MLGSLPRSARLGAVVLGILGAAWLLMSLFAGPAKIRKADISRIWHADIEAFRREHAQDFGIQEKDFQLINERFGGLVLDLSQETARVTLGSQTWEGPCNGV